MSSDGEKFITVKFSHDSSFLSTGSNNGSVRIWDIETGFEVLSLLDHSGWVWDIEFNPDSSLLASAGNDGTAKVWDVSSLTSGVVKDPDCIV